MLQTGHTVIGGIDYGNKLAGTTVLACGNVPTKRVSFYEAKPRQDADDFLLNTIQTIQLRFLFLDAPLSLPGVYRNLTGFDDYFYRTADRALQAMSPMFLGGLTARAIRLCALLAAEGVSVYETYPSAQARRLQLYELGYKKTKTAINGVLERIQLLFPEWVLAQPIENWHQVDALLAMLSAYRFTQGIAEQAGHETEGLIYW